MKKIKIFILFSGLILSCKEEMLIGYSEKPRIYFNLLKAEVMDNHTGSYASSILSNFAPKHSAVVTDTLLLRVQTTGAMSAKDRSFDFEIDKETTSAREGLDYKVLNQDFLIPADKADTVVRIVMLRNPELTNKEMVLKTKLRANEQFELGPWADTTRSALKRVIGVDVRVRDIVTKPVNWDSFIATYFGAYSEVRYRFVIDVLAKTDFPDGTSASTMRNNKTKLVNALKVYNDSHKDSPLQDEFGNLITF